MGTRFSIFIRLVAFIVLGATSCSIAWAVGLLPVPVLQDIDVQAHVQYDPGTDRYTYQYTFTNPPTNTGEIWRIKIDIRQNRYNQQLDSSGLTIPRGSAAPAFDELLEDLEPLALPAGITLVPIGQRAPTGWNGGVGRDGFGGFSSATGTPKIIPGASQGGFEIISAGVPTIRKIQVIPDWVLLVDDHGAVTDADLDQAAVDEQNMMFVTETIGPLGVIRSAVNLWDQVRDDLALAISLGWITDIVFADVLTAQLSSARQALDASDGALAKARLQQLINSLDLSTNSQRRQEIYDLLKLNALTLIQLTADTPIPFVPETRMTPR
jgi:hypothetical protein